MALSIPRRSPPMGYASEITALAQSAMHHPVMNCSFYNRWTTTQFSLTQLELFSSNYFRRVHATTNRVATALVSIPDWESKIDLLHNMSDELGHGHLENVHVGVLLRWIDSLRHKLGGQGSLNESEVLNHPLKTTLSFVEETEGLCRQGAPQAAGAMLAQEWHGYHQIARLFDGFLQYRPLYEPDEFHDVSEYFYVHLGRAEKDHMQQATRIAIRNCKSSLDFKIIAQSFDHYLNMLHSFWDSIDHAVELDILSNKRRNQRRSRPA